MSKEIPDWLVAVVAAAAEKIVEKKEKEKEEFLNQETLLNLQKQFNQQQLSNLLINDLTDQAMHRFEANNTQQPPQFNQNMFSNFLTHQNNTSNNFDNLVNKGFISGNERMNGTLSPLSSSDNSSAVFSNSLSPIYQNEMLLQIDPLMLNPISVQTTQAHSSSTVLANQGDFLNTDNDADLKIGKTPFPSQDFSVWNDNFASEKLSIEVASGVKKKRKETVSKKRKNLSIGEDENKIQNSNKKRGRHSGKSLESKSSGTSSSSSSSELNDLELKRLVSNADFQISNDDLINNIKELEKISNESIQKTTATENLTPTLPPPRKKTHNAIEKKYRNNINDRITQLKEAVPALLHARLIDSKERQALRKARTKKKGSEDSESESDDEDEGLELIDGVPVATKLNKATILKKATDYILFLRKGREKLNAEVCSLRSELESLKKEYFSLDGNASFKCGNISSSSSGTTSPLPQTPTSDIELNDLGVPSGFDLFQGDLKGSLTNNSGTKMFTGMFFSFCLFYSTSTNLFNVKRNIEKRSRVVDIETGVDAELDHYALFWPIVQFLVFGFVVFTIIKQFTSRNNVTVDFSKRDRFVQKLRREGFKIEENGIYLITGILFQFFKLITYKLRISKSKRKHFNEKQIFLLLQYVKFDFTENNKNFNVFQKLYIILYSLNSLNYCKPNKEKPEAIDEIKLLIVLQIELLKDKLIFGNFLKELQINLTYLDSEQLRFFFKNSEGLIQHFLNSKEIFWIDLKRFIQLEKFFEFVVDEANFKYFLNLKAFNIEEIKKFNAKIEYFKNMNDERLNFYINALDFILSVKKSNSTSLIACQSEKKINFFNSIGGISLEESSFAELNNRKIIGLNFIFGSNDITETNMEARKTILEEVISLLNNLEKFDLLEIEKNSCSFNSRFYDLSNYFKIISLIMNLNFLKQFNNKNDNCFELEEIELNLYLRNIGLNSILKNKSFNRLRCLVECI